MRIDAHQHSWRLPDRVGAWPPPEPAAMQGRGLCIGALVRAPQLPALWRFARRRLDLPIVIEHAAKPALAQARLQSWCDDMARLAMLPHVHCKPSGLLNEAGSRPELVALQPCVHEDLWCFGVRRVPCGSDWPMLKLAGDHSAWLALCRVLRDRIDPPLDSTARAARFGGNAQRFYRLPRL